MGVAAAGYLQVVANSIQEQSLFSSTPFVITAIAILSAAAGVALTSLHRLARQMVPFGGGVLIGVGLFWVLPEIASVLSWPAAVTWIAAGVFLIWLLDRFVYPVCPTCSEPHDHDHCAADLHGFAPPLLVAIALHAALDGWSVAAAGGAGSHLSTAFVLAIAIHKIPEGIALGVIARAALHSRWQALGWCALAESATLIGAWLETFLAPHVGAQSLHALLALAGGSFLYLGGHAIHGEWRRRGLGPAFMPALAGVASPTVLRLLGYWR